MPRPFSHRFTTNVVGRRMRRPYHGIHDSGNRTNMFYLQQKPIFQDLTLRSRTRSCYSSPNSLSLGVAEGDQVMSRRSIASSSEQPTQPADSLSFEDPELTREYEALMNEEDKEDFVQALRDLQETGTEPRYTLEEASKILGLS